MCADKGTSEIMIEMQNFNQFKLCCLIIWLETTHHFLMMVKNSVNFFFPFLESQQTQN